MNSTKTYTKLSICILAMVVVRITNAQPDFNCSSEIYYSYGANGTSHIAFYDPANVVFNYPFNLNAIGYNPLDDYIYGIRKPANHLIRFHSDGTYTDFGNLSGAIDIDPVVGGFDDQGRFYIREGNSALAKVVIIDVANLTTTTDDSGIFNAKDWAYHKENKKFYGVDAGKLHVYTPGNGTVVLPLSGIGGAEGNVYGSNIIAADGNMYTINNITNNIYRIDIDKLEANYLLTFNAPQGDGTACPYATAPFPVVYANDDTLCIEREVVMEYNITANDSTINASLNLNSFSVLDPPNFGTITYDNTTGVISYTSNGTLKDDFIRYKICGISNPVTCDEATIVIRAKKEISFNIDDVYCQHELPQTLPNTSIEGISGKWNPLNISTDVAGDFDYTFLPNASVTCALPELYTIEILPLQKANVNDIDPICLNDIPPLLQPVSNEGLMGSWSPANINSSVVGTSDYIFTPDANQYMCSVPDTISVTISKVEKPEFQIKQSYCKNDIAEILNPLSNNNIQGSWNPAIINTNVSGFQTYTFTPDIDLHPCDSVVSIVIEIKEEVKPIAILKDEYCIGDIPDSLPANLNDTITGIWSPSVINTTVVGKSDYTFTPYFATEKCLDDYVITVDIRAKSIAVFDIVDNYCKGAISQALPSASNNNIIGVWSPSTINTDIVGDFTYVFTPDSNVNHCVENFELTVQIKDKIEPIFDLDKKLCVNSSVYSLPTSSINNIIGSWAPPFIDINKVGMQEFIFTPILNQNTCPDSTRHQVDIIPEIDISLPVQTCSEDLLSYSITFTVDGGLGIFSDVNAGGYAIINTANGYEINNIPVGTEISINISDGICEATLTNTPIKCECGDIPEPTGISDQWICYGELPKSINIIVSPPYDVKWYDDKGTEVFSGNDFIATDTGQYSAKLINTVNKCLSDGVTFNINSYGKINFIENDYQCAEDLKSYSLSFSLNGGSGEYDVTVGSQQVKLLNGNAFEIGNIESGKFASILVVDMNNCTLDTVTLVHECLCPAINAPEAESQYFYCEGEELPILKITQPNDNLSINWYNENFEFIQSGNEYLPVEPGIYYTSFTNIINDCESSLSSISLELNPDPITCIKNVNIILPNVIKSGSTDGNNLFGIVAQDEIKQINYLKIYDRWGELVFEAINFNAGDEKYFWDGTFNGQVVSDGVYLYVVQIALKNNVIINKTGDITVIR